MHAIDAPVEQREVESSDGTRIAYFVCGKGKRVCALSPGLGTPMISWKKIFEAFQDHYTFVTWECRSTFRSGMPKDLGRLRVEDHVDDLHAICLQEGYEEFILGGWSMGVQVSLEYYHQHSERVRALLLINGAIEHVLDTALPRIPFSSHVLPHLVKVAQAFHPVFNPWASFMLGSRFSPALVKLGNMVQEHDGFFEDWLKIFSEHTWHNYFAMLLLLNEHSARDYLADVQVPTLITAGTADRLTPVEVAEEMQRRIPNSQLFTVPQASHFMICEYPEVMNLRLEKFFQELDPELFEGD